MSTRRTYQIEVKHIKVIQTIKPETLKLLEESLIEMIIEKFNKIKTSLSSCKIIFVDSILVIQDELGIMLDINEIVTAYGGKINDVTNSHQTTLKGKVYVIQDELFDLYELIQGNKQQLNDKMNTLLHQLDNGLLEDRQYDAIISSVVRMNDYEKLKNNAYYQQLISSLREQKMLSIETIETEQITEYEGMQIDKRIIGIQSDEQNYQKVINELNHTIGENGNKHKKNILNGTMKSIEVKAKKMGYQVTRKQNGETVQYVLVRSR